MTYIYLLHGDARARELALAEAKALSGGRRCADTLVEAGRRIDIAPTGYVLCGIELIARGPDVEAACARVAELGLVADGFAIEVRRIPRGLDISRRATANALALAMDGRPNLDDPAERFSAFVTAEGVWFGRALAAGEPGWRELVRKPHDCSSALPAQAARAVCNLVVRGGERVVDPCCGSGSLLVHAARLGAQVTGFDINQKMVWGTNKNLVHFGLAPAARVADAAAVTGRYDVLVTNVPYGRMSPISDTALEAIVRNITKLAPRGVIVAGRDLSESVRASGGEVRQVIPLPKQHMTRLIVVYGRG